MVVLVVHLLDLYGLGITHGSSSGYFTIGVWRTRFYIFCTEQWIQVGNTNTTHKLDVGRFSDTLEVSGNISGSSTSGFIWWIRSIGNPLFVDSNRVVSTKHLHQILQTLMIHWWWVMGVMEVGYGITIDGST